jgi:prevent-host-death family protein
MKIVNMHQAKSSLSQLVQEVESGAQAEVLIARNGRPAARLVPLDRPDASRRIGVAKGKFVLPDTIDAHNDEIARLFSGPDGD